MSTSSSPPVCARCGERIGVYEPCWLRQPDGTLLSTSLLALRDPAADPRNCSFFHLGCLAPEAIPQAEAAQ
jgi:hypothetical protein